MVNIGASQLETYLADAAKAQGRVLRPEPTPGGRFSDPTLQLCQARRPALYIKVVSKTANMAGLAQKYLADFTAQKYHKLGDEYSPDADLRGGRRRPGAAVRRGRKTGGGKDLSELECGQ